MFDGPEHESYVALCRELRLERERVEPGDFALVRWAHQDGPAVADPGAWNFLPRGFSTHAGLFHEGDVWLPRLDQWLAMLEAAIAGDSSAVCVYGDCEVGYACEADVKSVTVRGEGATREEAAARLWMAVIASKVPAAGDQGA